MIVEVRVGSPLTKRGKADLSLDYCGFHGELEVKSKPGVEPSAAQVRFLSLHRRVGAFTGVAGSLDEAKTFFVNWRRFISTQGRLAFATVNSRTVVD